MQTRCQPVSDKIGGMCRAWIHGRLNGWARFPLAGLLALLVLFGAVDLHPAGEEHGLVPFAGDESYVPEAAHPDQPIHLEQASAAERPHCPACLHHLQTRGALLRTAAAVAPPLPRLALAAEMRWVPAGSSRCPSGARAPPSLS